MPFLSRLAAAFSPPGSLASSKRERRSASSRLCCGGGELVVSRHYLLPHSSDWLRLHLIQHLGQVGTDLAMNGSSMAWMCSPPMEPPPGPPRTRPAAVGLADRIPRLELNDVIVVAIGHVQGHVTVVRLDLDGLERPVVQIGRPLVLDDAPGTCTPLCWTMSNTNLTAPRRRALRAARRGSGISTLKVRSANFAYRSQRLRVPPWSAGSPHQRARCRSFRQIARRRRPASTRSRTHTPAHRRATIVRPG